MNRIRGFAFAALLALVLGCSVTPERPVMENELMSALKSYDFVESPEEILAVLNKDGEVVVPATFRGRPVYVKILATVRGLIVEAYPRQVETPAP